MIVVARVTRFAYADLLDLPIDRFLSLLERCRAVFEREERDEWLRAAFVGWQVVASLSGKRLSFREYLAKLGLKRLLDG